MVELNNKIYKFRIVGNYDESALGSLGTSIDNQKTKFLICEDVMEADNADNARNGFRYLVARPEELWNNNSPLNYTGSVVDGDNPVVPNYEDQDIIYGMSIFDDSVINPIELTYSSDLKTYLSTFNTASTPIMNWAEINDSSIIKCYFIDINRAARTRALTGGGGSATLVYLPVWL